jgi:uncharacterized membrane protein (GlpM family)
LALAAYYPGSLSNDSITMYLGVAGGYWNDVKPPVMRHLWWLADQVVCGPGGLLVIHVAAYWLAVLLVATASARTALVRSAIVAGLGFLPPTFGLLATIWVDVSMMSFLLLGIGLSLHVPRSQRPTLFASLGFLAFAYGGLVRHNSIVAVLPLFALLAHHWLSTRHGVQQSRRTMIAAACLTVLVWGLGSVIKRWGASEHVEIWAPSLVWDLAAISVDTGEMWVPDYVQTNPDLPDRLDTLKAVFNRSGCSSLYWGTPEFAHWDLSRERMQPLPGDWLAAVSTHPGPYLRHRLHTTAGLLGLWRGLPWGPYYFDTETRGATAHCAAPNAFARNGLNQGIERLLRAFMRTPLYRLWIYCLIGSTVILFTWRRPIPGAGTAALIAASGLLYLAPQPLITPSVEFRYGLWTMVSATVAAILLTAAIVNQNRRKSADG